jgi:hypothetical protein
LKTIAVAAALATVAMTGASAQTVTHRQHHASLQRHGSLQPHSDGGYAEAYAATHTSLPTRPRYWNQGNIQTNTYPTYAPGVGGCIDDLGYGRVGGGCL